MLARLFCLFVFCVPVPAGGTGGQPPVASLLAMPRSLLVFQEDAYTHCLHGIEEVPHSAMHDCQCPPVAAAKFMLQQVVCAGGSHPSPSKGAAALMCAFVVLQL